MNISPIIVLTLGAVAGILFVTVFIISWIVTFRNRKIIQDNRYK